MRTRGRCISSTVPTRCTSSRSRGASSGPTRSSARADEALGVKVRVGFGLGANAAAGDAEGFAQLVDGLDRHRFDSLWLSERVGAPSPDPVVGLAIAAGRSARLKLGTSVQVLPGRNPALLAKSWATLDVLSGGRVLPAFGLGIVAPNEQAAFGLTREERAPWFDEV